nr:MAG TPA: hypothetical protein [Caudoviricetes sp.]
MRSFLPIYLVFAQYKIIIKDRTDSLLLGQSIFKSYIFSI